MSRELRRFHDYPLDYRLEARRERDERWMQSPAHADREYSRLTHPAALVGLDCEMVHTQAGMELARVTAVNSEHVVLVDELVRPEHPVLDYKTAYSGITEASLRHVTTTLVDARAQLLQYIRADTILVGHSLENDLRALKLQHDLVIDSAVIYPRGVSTSTHQRDPRIKHSLRHLAKHILHRDIQSDPTVGHDSAEDARVALELVQQKIALGPRHGFLFHARHRQPWRRSPHDRR